MNIGTYNVLGLTGFPTEESFPAIGPAGDARNIEHFTRVFSELDCDILALQEGVAVRAIQPIARSLECYLATFPSPMNWPGHLLSRFPILESRVFSHADPSCDTPPFSRTCGAALLSLGSATALWVVDVHLHPSNADLRLREADLLRDRLIELQTISPNLIVLGDFNSQTHEKVHQNLKDLGFTNAMETAGGGIQATIDTFGKGPHFIDHIYASPPLAPLLQTAAVIRASGFRHDGPPEKGTWVHSDHLPVVARFHRLESP